MQIVVRCPDCADQRVDPAAVTIRNCVDNNLWSYRFICPFCRRPSVSPVAAELAGAAVSAGSPLETWQFPAELAERSHRWPPFTIADQLELRIALAQPDWVEALCNPYPRGDA